MIILTISIKRLRKLNYTTSVVSVVVYTSSTIIIKYASEKVTIWKSVFPILYRNIIVYKKKKSKTGDL